MKQSESISKLAAALVAAQKNLKNPELDRANPYFKNQYATLKSVRAAIQPVFAENDLVVTQHLQAGDGGVVCETVVMHSSGEWMSSDYFIPVTKKTPQDYGVASTYARRYALQAIANVVGDEDTDGDAGGEAGDGEPSYAEVDHLHKVLADAFRAAGLEAADEALAASYKKYKIPSRQAIKSCFDTKALEEMIRIVQALPPKA